MADTKISALTAASTPLAGTEVLPIVQSGTTKKVSVSDLTAGRAVNALSLTTTSEVRQSGAATTYVYAYNPTAASGGVAQSSPRFGFYGSEWNSGAGAVSMSGYLQLQALTNNVASPTSKLSIYLAGNGGAPAEVGYFGSDGNSVGYGSIIYTSAGGGNVTLENTTAATSAVPQPSGKLILNSRSWNSANGNVGQTSYIRAITSTNNANPTVESIALAPSDGVGGQNECFIFKGNGDLSLNTGNLVIGTSGKGIDFSATPGTGTSELLADYEEGTFTATLTSATPPTTPITATAYYTKIGDTVTVYCSFRNVNNTGAAGAISVTGLPFTSNASNYAVGPVWCSRSTITNGLAANLSPSSTTITLLDFSGNTVSWLTTGAGVYAGFEITYKV